MTNNNETLVETILKNSHHSDGRMYTLQEILHFKAFFEHLEALYNFNNNFTFTARLPHKVDNRYIKPEFKYIKQKINSKDFIKI